MEDRIKRAIDNNDTSIFYSSDFVMTSSIREYILNNKKRIIEDIFSLKLWLDDVLVKKVYSDMDFVKASILVGNVDVADNFDNEEMHWFLTININKIIEFMLKKIYVLSSNTPNILINNDNFIRLCLDNGFIQILEFNEKFKKYYYENKYVIDSKCLELIKNGVIHIDKFSSKLLKNNPDFLLMSVKQNNYDCLFFTEDLEINKYIIDNYRFFKNDFYKYIRKNSYFVNTKLNIKLSSVKMLYSSCLKRDVFSDKIDNSLLLMAGDNFENLMSYLDSDSITYLFGKRISKLYDNFGNKIFSLGYEKIKVLLSSTSKVFERFVKIFDPSVEIKMENVREIYLLINKYEFLDFAVLKKETFKKMCENIKRDGVFDDEVTKVIDSIKKIIDVSYLEFLQNLIEEKNINISVTNKTSKELINEIFEYYRRSSINFSSKNTENIEEVIKEIYELAHTHEFDVYMSSRMNFSVGYPFLVEPSDVYLNRVYKEERISNIKKYILNDTNYFNYFCDKTSINFKEISLKEFKKDVKKYLENKKSLYGLEDYLDGVLSRLSKKDIVDISSVDYNNLPLTDEYLKTFISLDTIIEVLQKVNIDRLLILLNDDEIYDKFKEILYDKQWLFLLDCFKDYKGFYNKDFVSYFISYFDMIMDFDYIEMIDLIKKYKSIPKIFSYLFDNESVVLDSNELLELSKRTLKCLEKKYTAVPYTWEIIDDVKVEIGGFDIDDVYLGLSSSSKVMVNSKYDELHEFITTKENGFMIKFYKDELSSILYGIRYGNTIILCNLECLEDEEKIIDILQKFINNFVNKMKSFGDEIAHIYLSSSNGKLDKVYASCVKNIGIKIDYMENAISLYDNCKRVNKDSFVKYKIVDMEYSDASKRANKINILRLISQKDYENLIGYEYIKAIKAGRNWYKDSEDMVLE